MADTNATILIPDISGFTEFITTTELGHGAFAINLLIDAMVKSIENEYEVSEIEGDALLLIKKGAAPTQKEILDSCFRIFNSFHSQRIWIQQHAICPCGACRAISNLAIKFVAHHGPLAEIKVGRFVKQSGADMIVAHRLLKNSIDSHEYLLMTEKLLQQATTTSDATEMNWVNSVEEYPSIGKVEYRYTLLEEAKKKIPMPPAPRTDYLSDDSAFLQEEIAANYRDVYMVLMNIPGRPEWQKGLEKVNQDMPGVFVGSVHYCSFENFKAVISPVRMSYSEEEISYVERCSIAELGISLIHEFICKKLTDTNTAFSARFINNSETPIPLEVYTSLLASQQDMTSRLKVYCEKMETSLFEPMIK